MKNQGIDSNLANQYELDHVIPLAIGGHPKLKENLILQPMNEASRKDRLEVKLQCLVCNGQVELEIAQQAIFEDWESAYHRFAKMKCTRPRVQH